MGLYVTKALKSLVVTAAVAISLCGISAPATAEMIRYEFTNTPTTSDLLSGFFNYNYTTAEFGDVGISVDFGGSIGQIIFTDGPSFYAKDQLNPGFSLSSWSFEYSNAYLVNGSPVADVASFNIAASDLLANLPVVGSVANFRWDGSVTRTDIFENNTIVHLPILAVPGTSILQGDQSTFLRSAFAVSPVPEPTTYAMMAIGLLGIAGMRRRQNKA